MVKMALNGSLKHCEVADLFYRCLSYVVKELPETVVLKVFFPSCVPDRLNQTIKRYFRCFCTHGKYPLIVRLCPSKYSVSRSSSSAHIWLFEP